MRNCPVCKSGDTSSYAKVKDFEYSTGDDDYNYFTCHNCQTVFIDPVPANSLVKIYPSNYYSNNTEFTDSLLYKIKNLIERRMFRKILSQIKSEKLSVLDVGGGSGWNLDNVIAADIRPVETTVLEINELAKNNAIKKGHKFIHSSIETVHLDATYDLVLMFNLIEHIGNPGEALERIKKSLKPGGVLMIKTPNSNSLDKVLFKNLYWGGLHSPRHWIIFSKSSIQHLASQHGFDMSDFYYTQGASQWTMSILGSMVKLGLIGISCERPLYRHWLCLPFFAISAAFDTLRSWVMPTSQMFVKLKRNDA